MTDALSLLPEGVPLLDMAIPVRWGDMDALGHVNNTLYFRYFETVRMSWFESLVHSGVAKDNDGIVIVDNNAEYLVPIVYPADAVVRMAGHSPGRTSFVSAYTITVNEKLMTRGNARIVWINQLEMKSAPLPHALLALLAENTTGDDNA